VVLGVSNAGGLHNGERANYQLLNIPGEGTTAGSFTVKVQEGRVEGKGFDGDIDRG
jgi:hypothetical protein